MNQQAVASQRDDYAETRVSGLDPRRVVRIVRYELNHGRAETPLGRWVQEVCQELGWPAAPAGAADVAAIAKLIAARAGLNVEASR